MGVYIVLLLLLVCACGYVEPATLNIQWPTMTNAGWDVGPGDTVHFYWTDNQPHNVVQVFNWSGSQPPYTPYQDGKIPNEIRSGNPVVKGSFDWKVGTLRTGYRPGLYYFIDENNPSGGIVAIGITYQESQDLFPPYACSKLSDPLYYNGRYAKYATRKNCKVYEVNNYQTAAHFDWVYPTFGLTQGDLVIFQWSDWHNVVQVVDAYHDVLVPGGFTSGPKRRCVSGPNWQCINGVDGDQSMGEMLFDTLNHRPGIVHISDECALVCHNEHYPDGMGMEFLISRPDDQRPPEPVQGTCCQFDNTKGTDCRVLEMFNDDEGTQFAYNVPVGSQDLIRFRWSGPIKIYQSTPSSSGDPTSTPLKGGYGMTNSINCIPGPNWECLNNTVAEWVFDVAAAVAKGLVYTNQYYAQHFTFYAIGDNIDGGSSQNSGTIIYIDTGVTYNKNRAAVACPAGSTTTAKSATTASAATTAAATTGKTATTAAVTTGKTAATTTATAATSAKTASTTTSKAATTTATTGKSASTTTSKSASTTATATTAKSASTAATTTTAKSASTTAKSATTTATTGKSATPTATTTTAKAATIPSTSTTGGVDSSSSSSDSNDAATSTTGVESSSSSSDSSSDDSNSNAGTTTTGDASSGGSQEGTTSSSPTAKPTATGTAKTTTTGTAATATAGATTAGTAVTTTANSDTTGANAIINAAPTTATVTTATVIVVSFAVFLL